jgi:DNA-binding NarL/FixJ family response regulator
MITVGIVDDDPLALSALSDMVRCRPDEFRVGAAVSSVAELVDHADADSVDVVILDVRLGPGNSLAGNVEALTSRGMAILAVTSDTARSEIAPVLRHRPVSVLDKDELAGSLHDALRLTIEGTVVTTSAVRNQLNAPTRCGVELTARQRDVVTLCATGLPLKVVARRLGIGYKTAHDHYQEACQRLREARYTVDNQLALHYTAIELGYIPDPRETD